MFEIGAGIGCDKIDLGFMQPLGYEFAKVIEENFWNLVIREEEWV